ncbi:carbohydrate ABC transporter permease [Gracilibacillus phocaeensis]|uniref:carbohydrate ABC transporter permease n=1 Tax=Gracilibacillus phocaeensis TaxID=2042304 RepID=UPI0010320DA6|nr:sugar ABC transporter permease [Gracilibacillus phocaeensis]
MIYGRKKLIVPYLLPAIALYVFFFVYPVFHGVFISFHEWSDFSKPMVFNGIDNYTKMFTDQFYWMSLKNTLLILFVGGFFTFLIGFVYTAVMSEGMKGKKAIRAIIFFPNIIAPVAVAIIWNYLYRYDVGLFNSILELLNIDPVNWTAPENIMTSVIIGYIWSNVGLYAVIMMSGVDKIPNTIFESAKIEGASTFKIFFKITLPLIWDILSINIVLWTINSVRLFDFLYAFGGATPSQNTWNLALYQFILGFGSRTSIYQVGYASAIAVSMVILVSILIIVFRRFFNREVYEL